MSRKRSNGLSSLRKKAFGLSAAKGNFSRRIDLPLAKSGRQRKLGRTAGPALMLAILGLAGGAACVTIRLTPAGERVRVTSNPAVVANCKFLGEVRGRDRMQGGLLGQSAAEENAYRRLKNEAGKMGADTVLIITSTTGFSGSTIRGEAYYCGAAATASP